MKNLVALILVALLTILVCLWRLSDDEPPIHVSQEERAAAYNDVISCMERISPLDTAKYDSNLCKVFIENKYPWYRGE